MEKVTIDVIIDLPIALVWQYWTSPEDIVNWNYASDDWYCPAAVNNLKVGGQFVYTMSSKDKKHSFNFAGQYTQVEEYKKIGYQLGDSRQVEIIFEELSKSSTRIIESFDPEKVNSRELQIRGWQAILNNFKTYSENK